MCNHFVSIITKLSDYNSFNILLTMANYTLVITDLFIMIFIHLIRIISVYAA